MPENTVVDLNAVPAQAAPAAPPVSAESAPTAKPTDEMSSKFAALAKKERYARMLSQQTKIKSDALAKREAAIAAREKAWDEEFRSSPLEALKKRNINYQDITNAALNDGKFQPETEIKSVKEEIERLRQEQTQRETKSQEMQKQAQLHAETQAIESFRANLTSHIEKNTEKYELTKLYDASDLVFQTVEEHFNRTQKILSNDEACELVEQYLDSELERTSKESKKFQSKFMGQKAAEPKQEQPRTSPTLTNHMNSQIAPSMISPKNETDRIKRALAALG